ncbi:MAG TPA: L-glutamate gamma-semialdehyde dehydrogenase [Acidobacteriaceae bacterium]|nr:L-glutamate gamma-semialdehyde dehydrogenase [Acidobacteriaceae bacterium]
MATTDFSTVILPLAPEGAFRNQLFLDFSNAGNVHAMREALDRVSDMLGREYELIIGGERKRTEGKIQSINPANPAQVVGIHQKAQPEDAEIAVAAAVKAFETWRFASAEARSSLLLHAARIIRRRRYEFCSWLCYEVGKNWVEADADVNETIDFLEFYAREALHLAKIGPPIQYPGERDELIYIPLGVCAVIPPWNFPFAIMAGMTSAAIVSGNTVILKPSSESPTIAALFMQVLEEAGMPPGVVNFCPGSGAGFGNAIVEHPQTRLIAFTGSKDVGLEIHQRAARVQPGQRWIKRTILEMGGKDAIIVSNDCDLDAAVEGVVASSFGFSGQKCSACSRAIVEEPVYEAFLERLRDRVESLTVGDPVKNPDLGPVVSRSALETILGLIETGKREGRLLTGGEAISSPEGGYYLQPTVFADVSPDARIAQEEIFGPVLAVLRATDFDHALQIANNTQYGLTGAVYSRDREKLQHARQVFHVGNLYFNRKCTGAMVGAHPFGGFNLSGTDSKAGGPDYLYLFTQAKSIAEKLL